MKHVYRPVNCLSEIEKAHATKNQHSSFFSIVIKILTPLLVVLLLLPPVVYGKDKNPFFNWTSADWTVTQNVDSGSIDIHLLYYDHHAAGLQDRLDGWIKNTYLSYSIDGSNYTDFYYLNWDGAPQQFKAAYPIGDVMTSINIINNEADGVHYLDLRLYLTTSLQAITKIQVLGTWAIHSADDQKIEQTKDISLMKMSSLILPYTQYTFETVPVASGYEGKARINFSKVSLNDVDNLSVIQVYQVGGTHIGDTAITTNGSYYVPLSYKAERYYFVESAYGGRVAAVSDTITVKAFTLPKTASATYDTTYHVATFTWTMDSVTTPELDSCVTDRFKFQIASDPDFNYSSGTLTLDYYPGQRTYTYQVKSGFYPVLYFRVARNHTGFDWELAKTTKDSIKFNPLLTASVQLVNNNSAHVTWEARPSAWLPGATLVIKRTNNTNTTQTEFTITDTSGYKAGFYDDPQIAICNEYVYSVQVRPPQNVGFPTYSALALATKILPTEIGTISKLEASKGYFPDRVELTWTGKGTFERFIVKRAVYGTNNYVQLTTVPGATNSDFQADDSKGAPGVYYKYMIVGSSMCNNQVVYSKDTLYAVGFRAPTGNIYGRVTFENGQSVENVAVHLQSNDQAQLGQSVFLNKDASSYLKLDTLLTPFVDDAFTLEAWIKPVDAIPTNQVLFSRAGQYELGFNSSGKLYFTFNSTRTVSGDFNDPTHTYVHVAGIHRKDSMFLLVNGAVIAKAAVSFVASAAAKEVYIGRNAAGSNYNGNIDEIRVWNIALSPARIARDYTRLLAGNETGLAAYWRLDETIDNEFYDASHHGDEYNRNDGKVNGAVTRNGIIPEQLGLKDFTDSSGNYMITGIPFTGNGTTYTVVPIMGIHQFDPTSANRLISTASPVFTVDFKDKSSFAVSGHIRYRNSTVPVSGVQFKIDGQLAQRSNGTIIQTEDNGDFTISVPVGVHEVQAVKNNHVFLNDGKILFEGHNLNYQDEVSGVQLQDLTTIRFIGRVAGGAVQEAMPLGHSVSVNNLGERLSISMKVNADGKYLTLGDKDSSVWTDHLIPSNHDASYKTHKSRVVYQASSNQFVIYPDSITGEFVVDLIPEKFTEIDVAATGWPNIAGGQVIIDLSNKFSIQTSIRDYVDSSEQDRNGESIKTNYSDTVFYNASYKFIQRQKPSVAVEQVDINGSPLKYFGTPTYHILTFDGTEETDSTVRLSMQGRQMYRYGYPVFMQNQPYTFRIKAFEEYTFYIVEKNAATPKTSGGVNVVDKVPTSDGTVSIENRLRTGPTLTDKVSLDSAGTGLYDFSVGEPELTTGLKNFSAFVRFGQATDVSWRWCDTVIMPAYIMGGRLTGTDFVTAGPDKLLFVLRDPPGSKSFSFVEQGSKITTSSKYSGSLKNEGDEEFTTQAGYELITFTGIGVGVINRIDTKTGIGFGIHHEEHYTGSDTKENSTELTTNFKTSDDPLFVGPPGDVFVGYSSNITYGQSNNITIIRKTEFKKDIDILLYPPKEDTAAANHFVVQRAGVNIGEVFGTLFAYPQQHIEKILIPNLLNIRNHSFSNFTIAQSTEAQAYADRYNQIIYVSKLSTSDEKFGKSNSDVIAFPNDPRTAVFADGPSYKIFFPANSTYRTDTILVLNQYVTAWQKRMADNEKAKLQASLIQNYSFHSGAPIEYSEETVVKKEHEDEFSFVIGGSVFNTFDVDIMGSGFEFKFKEDVTTEHGGTFVSSTENTMKYGFTLASEGTDDYFSVDVSKAADSGFVFRTKGGSSGCPYAGLNETKYYLPGTIIDQPTLRNEVPVIAVENPVANSVPSSRKASFTLLLRNESEAKLAESFMLSYVNTDAIKGATIAVDGLSIADGRTIPVQYGETVQKVLTIERGPGAMDYNDIMILWRSPCQYDPTGYRENIADTVLVSAHFIPSCSDIAIKSPKDKWVLNTSSLTDGGKRYLPIIIDQFDVTNPLFHHIELQYKPASTSEWKTVMKFYHDQSKMNGQQGEMRLFTGGDTIQHKLFMDDVNYKDEAYDIQAVSICDLGAANYVTTESNMVSGIKDTYYPRLFGSPQPANGILTVNDDIRLNFNETIAAGLLATDNFQVTGIRNGAKTGHSASVKLDGAANYLATEFDKSFAGKNVTAEMWIKPATSKDQTIFSHGDASSFMELGLTSANKLKVTVGTQSFTSGTSITTGDWAHVALVYNDNTKTVAGYINDELAINPSTVNAYTGTGHIEFGRSISNQSNNFNGQIHDARIWSDTLNGVKLKLTSLKVLSGSETGLLAYYPMNEGKGTVVLDKANGSNAMLNGLWSLDPATKAVKINSNGYVKVNTATVPITSSMDYTLELWFKGDASQGNSTLASNGKGDGTDPTDAMGLLNLFSLGFESGVLTFRSNGSTVQASGTYLDGNWHHVAVAINRNSGNGQLTVDGLLNQFFDAEYVGGIVSDSMYLGARCYYKPNDAVHIQVDRYFTGSIDEFRLWETYLDQNFISKYNNTRLRGDEVGLLAYYPFEEYTNSGGIIGVIGSKNDAKVQTPPVPVANVKNGAFVDDAAPIKDRGPVENLLFDFVVNNDALIINVNEPKASIDKSVITLRAEGIKDLHDNMIQSPITWTAYIDQNLVKWSDKEINLQKFVGEPLSFSSYLVNNGGNSQHYTVSNMPSWLTASPSSGSVDPNSNQKILFTVSQGLNIGSYEEMIVMHNDNNETEVLKLTLKVKAKQPDWVVNPSDYLYNMVVYGRLRFNNIFSTNEEDMLSAFLGGKCIGLTHNTRTNNAWYAFLTMYGNDVTSTNIEFRLWEAKTGKIYIATPSTAIAFNNNTVVGSVGTPVIFDASTTNYRNIVLNQNWNWISFNLTIPANTSLNTTLQDGNWIMDDQIKNEAASTFSNYTVTSGIGWTGTLKTLDNLTAYKLKATTAQSLPVNGKQVNVDSTLITLKGAPTWSYISYLPPFNATVMEALAGYMNMNKGVSDGDVIKSQTGFAMYSSAAKAWVGSLTYMEPGKGYMFLRKATTTVSFKYPLITGSLQGGRVIQGPAATAEQRPVPANFTHADNMTVIAILSPDFDLRTGDSIIAYVNGEVRGKAKPILNPEINKYTWFFTIGGDAEQAVVFVVERGGSIVAQSSTIVNYSSNKMVGTLSKPLELQFVKLADLITVNPNPFTQLTTINVDLSRLTGSSDQVIQLSVFDVTGRTVWGMPLQKVSGPKYTATWNGKNNSGAACSSGVYIIQVAINGVPYSYKLIKQ